MGRRLPFVGTALAFELAPGFAARWESPASRCGTGSRRRSLLLQTVALVVPLFSSSAATVVACCQCPLPRTAAGATLDSSAVTVVHLPPTSIRGRVFFRNGSIVVNIDRTCKEVGIVSSGSEEGRRGVVYFLPSWFFGAAAPVVGTGATLFEIENIALGQVPGLFGQGR